MTIAHKTGGSVGLGLLRSVSPQGAVILMGAVSLGWHGLLPLNHDVAWIWEGARRLLDGARFGTDVVDVNPPLAWWLTLIPVVLSRAAGLSASFSFTAFVIATGAAALLLSLRLLAGRLPHSSVWTVGLIGAWAVFLLPGYDFGQREHLTAALALPYLCAAALRAERQQTSNRQAWVTGILGGIGFCLKPHFLLIPLFVEVWLWWRTRRLAFIRIETLAILGVAAVYLAAAFMFAPAYLFDVVPDAAVGYASYDAPFIAVTLRLLATLVPVLLGVGLVMTSRPQGMQSALTHCFLVSALGAAAVFLVQSKGWTYQMLPALVFASLAAAAATPTERRNVRLSAVVGLMVVLLLGAQSAFRQLIDADGTRARVIALATTFGTSANGKAFAFITSPRDVHPAIVESGATWIAPACCLHLLPAAVAAGLAPLAPGSHAAIVAGTRQAQAAISLLIRYRPGIVAVDGHPDKLGFGSRRFDYLRYFLRDARFARFWRRYRETQDIGGYRIFRRVQ